MGTMDSPRVAGAGICCLDYIATSPRVEWGETASVTGFCVQGGGLVATALVACARLGAQCEMLSYLGDDQTGEQIAGELLCEGVGTQGIVRVPGGSSPFSFIHVDKASGERTIFHRSGVALEQETTPPDVGLQSDCDVMIVDNIYPALSLAAAKACRDRGVPVVADLIPSEDSFELLKHVDVLIAPRHYARRIGVEDDVYAALDRIHKLGPTTAVITLGSDGWAYSDPDGRGRGKAYEVEVVDTTGAGDTFHGAFAYGLARGWDTIHCCDFAAAVASIKCTKPGGRTALPSLADVARFMGKRSLLDWSGIPIHL